MRYAALLHKDEHSSYGVSFPDLPGCFSGGETEEEAMRNAAEALALHVEALQGEGRELPAPSSFELVQTQALALDAKVFQVITQ